MQSVNLAEHAYACQCGDQVVVLDIRSDRYFSFSADEFAALPFNIQGVRAAQTHNFDRTHESSSKSEVAEFLVSKGLVVLADTGASSLLARPLYSQPVNEIPAPGRLDGLPTRLHIRINLKHIIALVHALRTCRKLLQKGSFEGVVENIRRTHSTAVSPCSSVSDSQLEHLVSSFYVFRSFTYDARDHCLLDTFIFITYLNQFRIYPYWIFGVQADPFSAHCWAQLGNDVLNDRIDHISQYTPIATI
jgi:hypothetical protein